ncbi:MAG: response regulator [Helicobacteraceae bacterium]|nr:response regulator [Helicobacteraceae bacterium]
MIENLKNTNLLFVEDDDIIRKQYAYIFRSFFSQVLEARSALEGLEHFRNSSLQCIISDIVMSDMNGIEFIKEIREIDKKIPIIIFSSHPTQRYLLESVKLNLTSFLIKPVSFGDIKKALEECATKMITDQLLKINLSNGVNYCSITKILTTADNDYVLTKKESLFLELLIKNRHTLVSKDRIEESVYFNQEMSDSALKNLVLKLRKKFSENIIMNVSGHGYLLN